MKKNLKYYMDLDYPIEVRRIPEHEGGGYMASIPLLGKYAFVGDGDTVEEAIENLNQVKKELFKEYLEKGIPIPEPEDENEPEFSGKFLLRIPSELHRYLAIKAKENHTTLNQYCVYLLTRRSYLQGIHEEIAEIGREIRKVWRSIQHIRYRMEGERLGNLRVDYSTGEFERAA